jgi:hypothetical protein
LSDRLQQREFGLALAVLDEAQLAARDADDRAEFVEVSACATRWWRMRWPSVESSRAEAGIP